MKKKLLSITYLLLLGTLVSTGCQPSDNRDGGYDTYAEPYYEEPEVWVGPGWYYGVYFSNEGRYRSWHGRRRYRRRHRRRYYRRSGRRRGYGRGGRRSVRRSGGSRRGGGGRRGGRGRR